MKTKTLLSLVAALSSGLLAASSAHAQSQLSDQVLFFNQLTTIPEGTAGTIEPIITLGTDPTGAGITGYVSLLETTTGGNVPQNVSDYIWVDQGTFFFASDGDPDGFPTFPFNAVVAGNPLGSLPETGGFQDVSSYFGLPTGALQVMSDVDVVPEPSTMALLGLGGLAFVQYFRRRKA